MRCKGMKAKVKNGHEMTRNCGKPAKVFFRVKYRELFGYRDNSVMEDVFGFCEECAKGKEVSSGYGSKGWRCRQVLHLRGDVASVELDDESAAKASAANVRVHDAKRAVLRMMELKGAEDIANDWPEIFRLAWEEFQIRAVMER